MSLRLLKIGRATERAETVARQLETELAGGAARGHLDALLELLALHIAETGASLVTAKLRGTHASLRARVEARPNLRLALPPQKDPSPMFEIAIAASCLSCGHPGLLALSSGNYSCTCSYCYDGTEDSHPVARAIGYGSEPDAAVGEWLETQEDRLDVAWWPDTFQHVAIEGRRQAGWARTVTSDGVWWAPEALVFEDE